MDPKRRRRRTLLLATGPLSVGTLLAACSSGSGSDGPRIIANPKGSFYDTGGYAGQLVGNPKGSFYDTGGYGGSLAVPTGGTGGQLVPVGNPKGSWYDAGGYDAGSGDASVVMSDAGTIDSADAQTQPDGSPAPGDANHDESTEASDAGGDD